MIDNNGKIVHPELTTIPVITFTPQTYVEFRFPFDAAEIIVKLHNPVFNDTDELSVQRIYRETRGGDIINYVASFWPKVRTFKWKFEDLYHTDLKNIQDFIEKSLGQYVGITDYLGRNWKAMIVDPGGLSEDSRILGGHSLEITWEGEQC